MNYAARTGVSILQDWVTELPIRYQGTLLGALRGCDGQPKEDAAKTLTRAIRVTVLNPADPRELAYKGGYMSFQIGELYPAIKSFVKNMDHYPLHFVTHLMHALEVIGYKHPDPAIALRFKEAYYTIVWALHLIPESWAELDARMTEDRVAKGTV